MSFFRLVKPNWGKPKINNDPNLSFVREIKGPNILEGCFTPEYLKEKNLEGYNIYFFPNHPSQNIYTEEKKFLNGKDIDVFNCIFADMDLKDKIYETKEDFYIKLQEFPLPPSLVVTSGNGVHAYWNVQNLTRESYIYLQFGLINYFRTDESVWTILQLMRLPGSYNTKDPHNFKEVIINQELSSAITYDIQDIISFFPEPSKEQINKLQNHLNKLDGKSPVYLLENINLEELPDSFLDLIYENSEVYNLFVNPTEFYKDRSAADMKLVNILFNKGFAKMDALAVIANSQKGLSKGNNRLDYAMTTVDKAYVNRVKNKFLTVDQKLKSQDTFKELEPVCGPSLLDCLQYPWSKKQVLGLIAGPGIGKTTLTLFIFREMIKNNPNNDDIFIFFSLEMPESDIIKAWSCLIGNDVELNKRLYVIGNEDENDEPRNIGVQQIFEYANDIKLSTGRNIRAIAIDHIGILSSVIDITKKYKFGGEEAIPRHGSNLRTLTPQILCTQMKSLAKMLDTFLIVLTQTTKAKGIGDVPIQKDGAYGVSQYENIMDYIITIWQPLMRVQDLTELRFLAWQYAKIRKKGSADLVKSLQHKILTYSMDTGDLRTPTYEEYAEFSRLLPEAEKAREALDKKKVNNYSRSLSKESLDLVTKKLKNQN